MDKSKVEGFCEPEVESGGKTSYQGTFASGSEWLRLSYERRDRRIQVQYLLLNSRGCVHTVIDGIVSREAERWHNNVAAAQRDDCGIVRIELASEGGWTIHRMVGEVYSEWG